MIITERMLAIYNLSRASKRAIETEMISKIAGHLIDREEAIFNAYQEVYVVFVKYRMDPTISISRSHYSSKRMSKVDEDPLMLFPRIFRLAAEQVSAVGFRDIGAQYLCEGYRAYARLRELEIGHTAMRGLSIQHLLWIDRISRIGKGRIRYGTLISECKEQTYKFLKEKYLK